MFIRSRSHIPKQGKPPARAGFSLIEVLLAGSVMAIAVVGAIGSIASSSRLGNSNEETTRAYQAARQKIEELLAADINEVFAQYNSSPADDPGGVGTGPGPDFAVAGLDPRPDDADGMVGEILFPVNAGAATVLRENYNDPSFGMPRDLNCDGQINGADVSADYFLLPVRVRLAWTGQSGNRVLEIDTLLRAQ